MDMKSQNPNKIIEELSKGVSPISDRNNNIENQIPFPLPLMPNGPQNIGSMHFQIVQQSLPEPEVLAQYAEISPKLLDAFISNIEAPRIRAEEEQKHRHQLETSNSSRNFKAFILTHVMGSFLTLCSISGAVYCANIGQAGIGSCLAVTTISIILAAFLGVKRKKSSNEDEKKG